MSEVRRGYKQTEVGMIPEDWQAQTLGELGQFKNGVNKDSAAFGHGSPFVNLMDVFGVHSISSTENLGLIACSGQERSTYDLKRGDVLFVRSSVKPSGVGLTAVVTQDLPETVYSGFLIRFRDDGALDIAYKRHCFHAERFRRALIGSSSVSANTNVSQDSLKALTLVFPQDVVEQATIAEALSDADALIESLEQLLTRKRQIKQGAMQDLLTGKKRLVGFQSKRGVQETEVGEIPNDWQAVRLTTIAQLESGHTPSRRHPEYWDGDIPWISLHDTDNLDAPEIHTTAQTIGSLGLEHSSARLLPEGTVVFSRTATVGKCTIMGRQMATSQDFANYICGPRIHNRFLRQLFLFMQPIWQRLMAGSTLNTIYMPVFEALRIPLPMLVAEQEAIASVLSDMDSELSLLETKLAKVHHLKQAMMQELLTGRNRLV